MFENIIVKYIATLFISMVPIIELRGAIPIAVGVFHLSYFKAFIISFIGNILPVYFILKFIGPIFNLLRKVPLFKKFIDWITDRTTKKIEENKKLQTYTVWGLFLFVAIPLPGTGAWTGALIANFLNLPINKAMKSIILGVFTAGIIILTATAIVDGGIKVLFN